MNFLDDFRSFIETEDIAPDFFVPVPVSARTPGQAAESSENLAGLTGEHIFIVEDRWWSQNEAIRSRMLAHCGRFRRVHARCCQVRRIAKPVAAAFLEKAHSYGDASCRFRYGLFLKEELVAVAEFSSARNLKKGERTVRSYEWVRYASIPGVRVTGGMGKMLEAFAAEVNPDDVMSYADLEWSDGSVYRKLGFVQEDTKSPVTFAVDPSDWSRKALKPGFEPREGSLYYRNFGSVKYRKTFGYEEKK